MTNHPQYGPIGGSLDRVRFPKPIVKRVGKQFNVSVSDFAVLAERICGDPSSYVLVAGVVKTSATNLRTEIELQAEPLTAEIQEVHVRLTPLSNLDEADVFKLFIRLIHSKSRELVATQDSEEWSIKDLIQKERGGQSESKIKPQRLV